MERETRSRCVAGHPRSNCNIYNTGNILNSIIPVLYQCIVTCMHEINYAIVLRIIPYPWYQQTLRGLNRTVSYTLYLGIDRLGLGGGRATLIDWRLEIR